MPRPFLATRQEAMRSIQQNAMCRTFVSLSLSAILLASAAATARAQAMQDHQYGSAEIEAGSRLYAGQCSICHGANGDGVTGVDLRRGQFKRAVGDEDLARVIADGVPAAGMPPFKFQASETSSVIAFIRAGFDTSGVAVKVGNASRGAALFGGK